MNEEYSKSAKLC